MQFRFLFAAAALAIPTASHAQNAQPQTADRWQFINVTADSSSVVLLDRQSLQRDGTIATVWVQFLMRSITTDALGTNYKTVMLHETFNCTTRNVALTDYTTWTADGSTAGSKSFAPVQRAITPGSVDEGVFYAVCK